MVSNHLWSTLHDVLITLGEKGKGVQHSHYYLVFNILLCFIVGIGWLKLFFSYLIFVIIPLSVLVRCTIWCFKVSFFNYTKTLEKYDTKVRTLSVDTLLLNCFKMRFLTTTITSMSLWPLCDLELAFCDRQCQVINCNFSKRSFKTLNIHKPLL